MTVVNVDSKTEAMTDTTAKETTDTEAITMLNEAYYTVHSLPLRTHKAGDLYINTGYLLSMERFH